MNTEPAPFDRTLPSPLAPIISIRSDGSDSVVPLHHLSELQDRVYRPGALDEAIVAAARSTPTPHIIIATGSAGSGKSAALEYARAKHSDLFSDIIEDATHSDSPDESQADTLHLRLTQLQDGTERPSKPILLAANTGMLLQLFDAWEKNGARYTNFRAAALGPLGLSSSATPTDLHAVVLNLDERPTAGEVSLLSAFLEAFDLDRTNSLSGGAARCETCTVVDWCAPRTNAYIASGHGKAALGELGAAAARERGRHYSPRATWDWLSRIVAPAESFVNSSDPCERVAQAAAEEDYNWLLNTLLPATSFLPHGEVGRTIQRLNPVLGTSQRAYELMSSTGIDSVRDAEGLRSLGRLIPEARALDALASALESGRFACATAQSRQFLAQSVVTCALLNDPLEWKLAADETASAFNAILKDYADWQKVHNAPRTSPGVQETHDRAEQSFTPLVQTLGEGLAKLFGVHAQNRSYLPLSSYDRRKRGVIFIAVDIDIETASPVPDLQAEYNEKSAELLGHQPLAVRLRLPSRTYLNIDSSMYRLLVNAQERGLSAASQSDERLHALRRAAESLARDASQTTEAHLLAKSPDGYLEITRAPSFSGRLSLKVRGVT